MLLYAVIKDYLGNGVIDIDGRNFQFPLLQHLVEVVNSCGGLLRDALDSWERNHKDPAQRICLEGMLNLLVGWNILIFM